MDYQLPKKNILEGHTQGLERKYYNLSKLVKDKEFNTNNTVIPLGIDNNKEKYYIDINNKSGILISGETGSGKSLYLNSIIISLLLKNKPEYLKFIMIDYRNVELNIYNNLPSMYTNVITNEYDTTKILDELSNHLDKRIKLFETSKVKDIVEYNSIYSSTLPRLVIIIDEAFDILEKYNNKSMITTILENGSKYGLHIILATSSYLKNDYDKSFITLFDYILSFDLANKEQAKLINIKDADLLTVYGEALIKTKNKLYNVQTPYVSEDDIKNIINEIVN
ncbi:MAG: DNA translocase FtsK [Bacilli bacterium]|nr:DNA translocase FtsK [Bacilli bacterium]